MVKIQIFSNHAFEDIAQAISTKYGMLVPGWRAELLELKQAGSTKLDWFTQMDKELQRNQGGNTAAQGALEGRHRVNSIVPAIANAGRASLKLVKGLVGERAKVDKIIDEICDTEQSYHDSLAELLESYVKTVRAISSGQKGQVSRYTSGGKG